MSKGKVLVVDDEAKIRRLLELYLVEHEYEVVSAESGEAALLALDRHDPDVIVLDILLTDMNGLDVCQAIRSRREEVPIIFLSSLQESETIVAGLELGGDDYLTKPFDPNELVARVNAVLRRAKGKKPGIAPQEASFELLTGQEKLILRWIEKGYSNKEIADELQLKEGTIKVYNHVIFQKLQVRNRTQAIVRAKEERLI